VTGLRVEDLDFPLPEELIARQPAAARDAARLLVVRGAGAPEAVEARLTHARFSDFPSLLRAGDLLVLNDTRVLPARLALRKASGGHTEGLWLADEGGGRARLMLSGGRLRPGVLLATASGGAVRLVARLARGEWSAERADAEGSDWEEWLRRHGQTPLPPYVRRLRQLAGEPDDSAEDRARYQTVWARAAGSVAAPTASLHLDEPALAALRARGVELAWITLHVGRGTFLPVSAPTLAEHRMHEETFLVPDATARAVEACRARGGRVFAAGTTVCRALEAAARGERDATALLIAPGHEWRAVDALLTNFHTPRSTLLALVAAFAERIGAPDGLAFVKAVYAQAVARGYRFYSFGDATCWLPSST
jgi:S-adenosylmethionine:tRNA ribosyltransferase-isomerase